jgi:anti-sigma factor RsiW
MSCSPFDLRDYFLQELSAPQRSQVEAHVKTCSPCQEELDRLRITEAALLSVREEEIPQRIAFVSDKIFEPSPWRRWWNGFWGSAARLSFASAAMLSAAIVVYAVRPAREIVTTQAPAPPPTQVVHTVSDAEIQSRIDAAVQKAVEDVAARQSEKTVHLTAELEDARKRLQWAATEFEIQEKRLMHVASLEYTSPRPVGDSK